MDLLQVGATWLHLLATVALLGYYAVFGLIVLPAVRKVVPAPELGAAIVAIHRRSTAVVVASLVVFLATGVYLMVMNERYEGVGNVGGSWATLLLVKHGVIAVMVGIGVYIDALVVRGFELAGSAAHPSAVRRLARAAVAMTALGAVVLFLTAAAQGG
ncbi:MAG: hypothetical protein EPO36_12620 [Chloroflexota bacterium]|nr:MAG: hypothetical protein EPO36_12620 [Chloroflexota bacterium]